MDWKRHGLLTLQGALVVLFIAASIASMADPQCRERTLELTADGMAVGALVASLKSFCWLCRLAGAMVSWWAVRVLLIRELKYGLLGGYLLGITHAVAHLLTG